MSKVETSLFTSVKTKTVWYQAANYSPKYESDVPGQKEKGVSDTKQPINASFW
jgi:hypothetical protein